jgi:hypothetical protein
MFKNSFSHWTLVAHTCNPSYSGGRDQEVRDSKPSQANSSRDPIVKKTLHKRGGVAQGEGSELKPQYHTQKKAVITGCGCSHL